MKYKIKILINKNQLPRMTHNYNEIEQNLPKTSLRIHKNIQEIWYIWKLNHFIKIKLGNIPFRKRNSDKEISVCFDVKNSIF